MAEGEVSGCFISLPNTQPTDAEFVFSVLVRESKASAVGDDDKIYYFFMEREEGSSSFTQSRSSHRVARVARVCKVRMVKSGYRVQGEARPLTLILCPYLSREIWEERRSYRRSGHPS